MQFPEHATRADMGEARDPRLARADEGNRAFDLAQRPQCEREHEASRDAGVLSEAKGEIVVPPGLEQGECAFKMIVRLGDTRRRTSG